MGREYVHDCTLHTSTNAKPTTRVVVLSARMAEEAEVAREFMRRALDATGLSPYKLAKKAGIAPSTITRPLNDPTFKFVPKQATLNKIAEAAGLTAPTVAEASPIVEAVSQWVPLVGEVRAGNWAEVSHDPLIEEHIAVHLPEYARASLFALRVVGRSMDQKYPDGSVVIAAPAIEAGIRVGDDVVVRRYRDGLAETTLKEVTQNGDGYELTPRSSDATFKPLPFPRIGDASDQDGIEIIGVVITHQPPPAKRRGPLVILGE
jgi:SOS-response transcriptional repressor LexA